MRCIYKVLFTRVHPGAEKVNTLGKCSPRCSPFGNLRLKVLVYSMSHEAEHQAEYWTLNTENGVKIAFYGCFKSYITHWYSQGGWPLRLQKLWWFVGEGSYFSFFEGEKYKDDNHAWDDEMVGTEYREAQSRDNQSWYTAGMIFFPKPVVGEDSCKHGGQHEVQSFSCGMFGLLVCWFMLGLFCRFLL